MTSQGVQAARGIPTPETSWLWTWDGVSFGYRLGNSLFTCDGTEVGRFLGREVYGVDGRYLGELSAEDDGRLVTNIYKKSRTIDAFVPTFETAYKRPENRASHGDVYIGHEDFPSPETAKRLAAGVSPA